MPYSKPTHVHKNRHYVFELPSSTYYIETKLLFIRFLFITETRVSSHVSLMLL